MQPGFQLTPLNCNVHHCNILDSMKYGKLKGKIFNMVKMKLPAPFVVMESQTLLMSFRNISYLSVSSDSGSGIAHELKWWCFSPARLWRTHILQIIKPIIFLLSGFYRIFLYCQAITSALSCLLNILNHLVIKVSKIIQTAISFKIANALMCLPVYTNGLDCFSFT